MLYSIAVSLKIDHDFDNKVVLKLRLQKNNFSKKYGPKPLFFIEKILKGLDDF